MSFMEISKLKPSQIRLKTKSASVMLEDVIEIERKSEGFVISEPGEYEVEGISVFAHGLEESGMMSLIQAEGLRILFINRIMKLPSEARFEDLGQVDIAILPVGDTLTMAPKELVAVVEKLEPSYVIPYELELPTQEFVKAYERGSREVTSLSVSVSSLPVDVTEVIVLDVKS
jgi:hypothetical protein